MKSTSSFTVLPLFGLYCSSKNFFMMRVGGQSGTAMVSVTSSAEAIVAPPTDIRAAKLNAVATPFIFVIIVILGLLPLLTGLLLSFGVRSLPAHLRRGRCECRLDQCICWPDPRP